MRPIIAIVLAATVSVATFAAQSGSGQIDLLGTAWLVEDIDGHGVIDRARSTMEFAKAGQIGGLAACNRYFGPVTLDGDMIAFGMLASTRKMCPESVMEQEQRFMEALSKVNRLELIHAGQVLLMYADGTEAILRFSKIVEK